MSKQNNIEAEATITEALGNSIFRAQLSSGHIVTAHLSGKIRMHSIQILVSDRVIIDMSPYDLSKGRIIRKLDYRKKEE